MSRMTRGRRRLGLWVVAGVLLCGGVAVQGQDLTITPTSWDYGNVVVGTLQTATFDLHSVGSTAVWVYVVYLDEDGLHNEPYWDYSTTMGPFSIEAISDPLPLEMAHGRIVTADVVFTPSSPEHYSAYLAVYSNDSILPPGVVGFFLLEGTGVAAVPAPSALLLGTLGTGLVRWLRRRRAL